MEHLDNLNEHLKKLIIEYSKYTHGDLSAIPLAKKELTEIIQLSKLMKEHLSVEHDQYKSAKAIEKEIKEKEKLEKQKTKELRRSYFNE